MTPDGPFIKLEGKDMIFHASENVVLKGFVPKEGYPTCCPYHNSVLKNVQEWWAKFPDCCNEHRKMVSSGRIKKENYTYVPEKIITCFAYFEYHLSQKINDDHWFTDIKHYIAHLEFSFGSPAIGYDRLYFMIEYHVKLCKPKDWVFPEDRRKALIEYLKDRKLNRPPKKETDLNLLYNIYQKWLKAIPDVHYFSHLKQTTTGKVPMNLFLYDFDYNPYMGMTSSQVKTNIELVQALYDITKQVLGLIDTPQMIKDGTISDTQSFKIKLINDAHRIKQLKLVETFNKSEAQYIKIIKRWLDNEKKYFEEIIPELIKLPPSPPKPKHLPHQPNQELSQFLLNDHPMTLSILHSICYGSLKPWTISFSDPAHLSQLVRSATRTDIASPIDLNNKLLGLLPNFSEFHQILKANPTFESIHQLPYTFTSDDTPSLETKFYKELIDTEALRYYNEVLANPLLVDLEKDVEYQVGRKVLDVLKDLIAKTYEELQNQQSLQSCKDADDLSLYVMWHLHKTLLALYFSVQDQYATFLEDAFDDIAEFYMYVLNVSNQPNFELHSNKSMKYRHKIESQEVKSPASKPKALSFKFSADQEELKNKVKALCLNVEFLNEGLTTQETFVNTFVSKDLSILTKPIHISCPTNLFPIIQEKLKKYAPNFKDAIIEKSKLFYSINGTQLTAQNISKSRKLGCQATELIAKVNKIFS